MPGMAQSNEFLLSTATIMIGPMEDLFNLNVAEHSLGLVKNVKVSAEKGSVELGQGIMNMPVASITNSIKNSITADVYEYTSKNLAYGLGMSGVLPSTVVAPMTLKTAIIGDDTTPVVAVVGDSATDNTTNFQSGDWIMIQERTGDYDNVHVGQLASDATWATDATTLALATMFGIKAGTSFTPGAHIYKMNKLNIGEQTQAPYYGMKIVGVLPNGEQALPLYYPKVKVLKGFDITFDQGNFGKMPFEFQPFVLTAQDSTAAIRALFGSNPGMMLKAQGL